jgi:hypothetical protein
MPSEETLATRMSRAVARMRTRLLQMLASGGRRLRRLQSPIATDFGQGERGRQARARARFWTDLRDGRREAEAHKAASLVGPR